MSRLKAFLFRKTVLVGLPVALIVLIAGSAWWLLYTSSGAAWLWNRLEGLATVDVRSSRVTGDLASGFVVHGLEYRSAGLDLLAGRAELEAGLDWWPVAVEIRRLTLQDVDITTRTATDTGESGNEESDIRSAIANLQIPAPLTINEALLTNVTLHQVNEPPKALFETVRLRAALDERIVLEYLEVTAADFEGRLQGHLGLEPPFELVAAAEGRFVKTGAAGETVLVLPFELDSSGDLDVLNVTLSSREHGLTLGGEVRDPLNNPVWKIRVFLDHLMLPDEVAEQGFALSGLHLDSRGSIDDWTFNADSAVQAGQDNDARIDIVGSGSASGIEVGRATVTGPGVDMGFSGELDWSLRLTAGLHAVIRQLDLSTWLPDWPAGELLAGELDMTWSEKGLNIPAGRLTVAGTDMVVRVKADIDVGTNRFNALLEWSELSWPPSGAATLFSSDSGQLSISGGMDEWVVDGHLDIQFGEYPRGQFAIRGGGNATSAQVNIPAGEILGGVLSGEANADWSDGVNWSAAVQARGIETAPILPEWPGRLDAEIEVDSKSRPQRFQIEVIELQGLLRGVPVQAHGGLRVTETGVLFDSFQVSTEEALLTLDGASEEPVGATVKFSGKLPAELLEGIAGNLELEGRYSSHASRPFLELQSQAKGLRWNGISIENLVVSTPGTGSMGALPALELDATSVAWDDLHADELSLSINPVGDRYELRTFLGSESVVLNSVMSLMPENGDEAFGGQWQGMLRELEVTTGPAYIFTLSNPAAFSISSEAASMGPVCMTENESASLCLNMDYKNNGDWSLIADAKAIPFDYLRDLLALDVRFEQLLEGRMEWRQPHGQAPTGGADFRISAGGIIDLLDDEVLARTDEGRFAFSLRDGNLESGVLDIQFPGTGFIDVDFEVQDLVGDIPKKLQGRIVTRLDHLTLAGQLAFPGVDAVDGQFESDITLSGSPSNPGFDGGFRLSKGFLHYAPVGLKLEDIEFEGQVRSRDRGDFNGRFRAGDGLASFDGRFQFDDAGSTRLEFDLAGDQLLLINTAELEILTQPDLSITLAENRTEINGVILIPRARLTPENLLLEEVRDSEDLVIETPGNETATAATEKTTVNNIFGRLEVALGDDVVIRVPGIETSIKGRTVFDWTGEPVPVAQGGYTVKGTVDVYGPTLGIKNGTINFPGVPADNPLLNIRAGRDIYGNTQIRSAGVQVIGTLKRPVLEAYTDPITNEDRAWTLLITGTDFDQAQGVGGFNVGTYIAPKLYVSYGISLFDEENVISARYDLKKGFGVKVTSGQRETGLDVSYTIDR